MKIIFVYFSNSNEQTRSLLQWTFHIIIFSSSPLHDRTNILMTEVENVKNQICNNNKTDFKINRPGLAVTHFTTVNIFQFRFVFSSQFLYKYLKVLATKKY